jgi:pimeloyl-ACP methyl ester carboxylesterase
MLPFFFGSKQRRLFGSYEPATRRAGAGAALLCGSWGTEYTNAHRAMRVLSKRLCATGFDTLRFDYFGAGDSGGETVDAELEGWKDDISTALRELREMSGASRLTLIGMRLGATLVAELAPQLTVKADGIVLWDPIVCGPDYVRSLLDQQGGQSERPSDPTDAAASQLGGLLVSSSFVDGLKSIDLSSREVRLPSKVLTIFTDNQHRECKIGSLSNDSEVTVLEAPSPWRDSAEQEEGLPVKVFERMLQWLR